MENIDNTKDIIDSRDVIERIEELETEYEDFKEEQTDTWDESDLEELKALKAVQNEAKDYAPDWSYGEALIRESYWVEYCEELCKDIGDLPEKLPWYIENHIDWDGVAEEIKMDYAEVDFDGITYFIRS